VLQPRGGSGTRHFPPLGALTVRGAVLQAAPHVIPAPGGLSFDLPFRQHRMPMEPWTPSYVPSQWHANITLDQALAYLRSPSWACACAGPPQRFGESWPSETRCWCRLAFDHAHALQRAAHIAARLMLDRAGQMWCVVDECPVTICGGPHRAVATTLGNEILRKDQRPLGEPL
jgi:hypothetical protein